MPVTELGCVVIKPGTNPMDEATHEGQVLASAWKAVAEAPTGPYRVYYGGEVEDPTKIWGFFDFESVEDHDNFAKTFGGEAVKELPNILASSEFGSKHVNFNPSPPTALKAPVTEILLAYFDPNLSQPAKDTATSKLTQFFKNALNKCPDCQGVNFGWGIENDFPVRGGAVEGQKGSILVALIGWPSVEAHMKFRDTEVFKENVHLLRGWEGNLAMTMFHVKTKVLENTVRKE
ncbi:hypothetical protein BC832DRAFT_595383 [Gaertneriomyces semiglobifer]|nr:hypothetical protein BC832DRAFT_595383 [Gaertneriomyces semiglobifer]